MRACYLSVQLDFRSVQYTCKPCSLTSQPQSASLVKALQQSTLILLCCGDTISGQDGGAAHLHGEVPGGGGGVPGCYRL